MVKLLFFFWVLQLPRVLKAQNEEDSRKKQQSIANADDPSQFFTRIEVFNELQRYNNSDVFINQTVVRNVVKIGKRFTTRIDLPYVYNSFKSPARAKQAGLGDISFRLLGYKFFETGKSAFTASVEISLNTAASPLLGTGKNLLVPVVSYTRLVPQKNLLYVLVLQQANDVWGDEERAGISFSKLQCILIKTIHKRAWVVLAPEWFLDYNRGGLSMNLRSRITYALTPRINIWFTPSAGIFGDFAGRYQWSADAGARYFLFRGMSFKKI